MFRGVIFGGLAAAACAEASNPVSKVIALLSDLEAKVQSEGKAEAAEYDKYACYCKEQSSDKQYAIEKSADAIQKLTADLEVTQASRDEKAMEISELAKAIDDHEKDHAQRTDQRNQVAALFSTNDEKAASALEAVRRAINEIKSHKGKMTDAKLDLAQVRRIAGDVAADAVVANTPHAYEFKSNDIIAVLESLVQKFTDQKNKLWEDEHEAKSLDERHLSEVARQIKIAKDRKAAAQKEAVKLEARAERLTGKKERETEAKVKDQSFLSALTSDCEDKALIRDKRVTSRTGELAALAAAKEHLKKGAEGTYNTGEPAGLVAKKVSVHRHQPATAFLQVSKHSSNVGRISEIASMIRDAGRSLHSAVLIGLSSKVSVRADHFGEVRGLITDLIAQLEAEAAAEADGKADCDTKMSEYTKNRDELKEALESLLADQAQKTVEKNTTRDEVKELQAQIASLTKGLAEATELRSTESKNNQQQIRDAEEGKLAVLEAIKILRTYYEGATSSFLQKSGQPAAEDRNGNTLDSTAPSVQSEEYKGDTAGGAGIIGMLDVILDDFEHSFAEVTQEETEASEAFKTSKADIDANIADKEKSSKEKSNQIASLEDELRSLSQDVTAKQTDLASVEERLVKHPCRLRGADSFADRKEKRNAEIAQLKSALKILREWDA